jgi:cytoskeleton protein RodZ
LADKKNISKPAGPDPTPATEPEKSLGQFITEARERKGLSREQVIVETHLPANYVKMIETDNYGLISDQLYLVPFLRKYATFLGLDAEEVAARFVRDVQHADSNVVRISQPLTMVTKRSRFPRRLALSAMILIILLLLADFAWRHLVEFRETAAPTPVASPAATALPSPASVVAPAIPEPVPPAATVPPPVAAPPTSGSQKSPINLPPSAPTHPPSEEE